MLSSNRSGQYLGPYELLQRIGAGGMGTVYRAFHAAMKREVAIKVLPEELAQNPEHLARFNREAETSTKLEHPHIVPVYDYGTIDGVSFVVMRLLPGGSLAQRLAQKGTPTLIETHQVLQQLASALDYAHRESVIHRDIKAGNVLFDRQGNAYLTDFGIAKLLNATSGFTATGISMGTPSYMAPEQWKGQEPSIQTDIYALGILLYTMVTGRLPFEAPTPFALMDKHLHALPSAPHTVVQGLPEGLASVIETAIAKQPSLRFASASAFAEAFSDAISGVQIEEPSGFLTTPIAIQSTPIPSTGSREHKATTEAARNWRRRTMIGGVLTLVTLIALLAVTGLILLRGDEEPAVLRETMNQNTSQSTTIAGSLPITPPIVAAVPTKTPEARISPTRATATPTARETATDATTVAVLTATSRAIALEHEQTQAVMRWTPTVTPDNTGTVAAIRTEQVMVAATAAIRMITQTAAAWTDTPTTTPSPTPSVTPSVTLSATPTSTATATSTVTYTTVPTATEAPTATRTETPTKSPSSTLTATSSQTSTPTVTPTPSPTATSSPSFTPTKTPTPTDIVPTATLPPSPTFTPTASPTPAVIEASIAGGLHLDLAFGSKPTRDVAFDGAGRYLALAQQSQEIPLFDREQGFKPLLPLYIEQGNVNHIAISPDARLLAVTTTYSQDGVLVFEDFATSLNPRVTEFTSENLASVVDVTFGPGSEKIYASGTDGSIYVWAIEQPSMVETTYRPAYQGSYTGLKLIDSATHLLMHKGATVEVRKFDQWFSLVFSITLPKDIRGTTYFEGQRLLAAVDAHGNIQVWQFGETGIGAGARLVYQERVTDRFGKPATVAFHPNHPLLARFSRTGTSFIDFKDAQHPVTSADVSMSYTTPNILQFSPDGRYLFIDTAKTLLLWSVPWYSEVIRVEQEGASNDLTGIVSAGQTINVRSAPDNYAPILGQLNPGDELTIVARNADSTWLQVFYHGSTAWVAKFLVSAAGDPSLIPVVGGDSSSGETAQTLTYSGTVRSLSSGKTVPAASVRLSYRNVSVLSDAEGYFTLPNVSPGSWQLGASALYHHLPFAGTRLWFDPRNEKVDQDVFLLENAKSIVKAKLSSDTGKPIENKIIRLYRFDTLEVIGEYVTDDEGFLPDIELSAGPYLIEVLDTHPRFGKLIIEAKNYDTRDLRSETLGRTNVTVSQPSGPETIPQSREHWFDLLIALASDNCPTRFATVFDLRTAKLLASATSNTQRIVISLDAAGTSGTYLLRFQTGCNEQVTYTVFEANPAQGWRITITEDKG